MIDAELCLLFECECNTSNRDHPHIKNGTNLDFSNTDAQFDTILGLIVPKNHPPPKKVCRSLINLSKN